MLQDGPLGRAGDDRNLLRHTRFAGSARADVPKIIR